MYKIDNSTAATVIPTPGPVGPNPNGFFTDGNPNTGTPATIVPADWLNACQEELSYVITQMGITLSKTTRTQLFEAIQMMIEQGSGAYVASTSSPNTYTATLTSPPVAYSAGVFSFVQFTHANTGAATINFNGLGAVSIVHNDSSALNSGDIQNGMIGLLMHDGTHFQLINPNFNPSNYLTIANYQNNSPGYVTDTGSANTYVATLSPAISSLTAGFRCSIKIANTNTGSSTLNVNSTGAQNITLTDQTQLTGNEMISGMIANFEYDGTNYQLKNPATLYAPNKNWIIGGDFSVNPWQRGTSFTGITSTPMTYTADRFAVGINTGSGALNVVQTADAPTQAQSGVNSQYCFDIQVNTAQASIGAGDNYFARYIVEGYDYMNFAGKNITLKFWVKATVTGTYCMAFQNYDHSKSYITTYTVNNSNTWEKKIITIPTTTSGNWNYTNGTGLYIVWILASGSTWQTTANAWQSGNLYSTSAQVNAVSSTSNHFKLALVQLNAGLQSLPFEIRHVETELIMSQRYYRKTYSQGTTPGTATTTGMSLCIPGYNPPNTANMDVQRFAVMRTAPTVTFYSPQTGTSGKGYNYQTSSDISVSSNFTSDNSNAIANASGGTLTTPQVGYHFTLDAENG